VPATKLQRRRAYIRANLPWRRILSNRTVRRRVQGVDLYLPWSHLLPDFARHGPEYGQNLVQLAKTLQQRADSPDAPVLVLDIGANIGDSAAQIIAATNAKVLCVEGDPYWAEYLRKNLGDEARATIEEALLVGDADDREAMNPMRARGTTSFAQVPDGGGTVPTLPMGMLRAKHPDFDHLRLIKSDTDGFDHVLVPAAATAWKDDGPVLFFEFDPALARSVGPGDPNDMWAELANLGYSHLGIWDNTGGAMGQLDISEALTAAASLEPRPVHLGYHFWDVAAVRSDDVAGRAALDQLLPQAFSVLGTRR
jgi:FkbM family methyltransferase